VEKVRSSDDLMEYISSMNRDNSVCQVIIPGKGKFTIVFQEEDQRSIAEDVEASPQLKQMIRESMEAYKEGRSLTTAELIKTLSPKDFNK
jgi:hypothetical protein